MSVDSLSLKACAPPLAAKLAPWMERLLGDPAAAFALVKSHGSPVHAVVTSEFHRNVQDLLSPLKERKLNGGLYFARKANKLPWFVEAARQASIGVDTASLPELIETLDLGVLPSRVVVTAVGKERALIELAVSKGCLIVADNQDELDLVKAVSESFQTTARVGIRLSGFAYQDGKLASRFGFSVEEFGSLLQWLNSTPLLKLEVLHAHLDKYDPRHRVCAGLALTKLTDVARAAGQAIKSLDLGGGIVMRYLDQKEQWEHFLANLRSSILHPEKSFTYEGDGFGYQKIGSTLSGEPNLYPAWNSISKERFIEAILDDTTGGAPLHREFGDRGLEVFFEPGRALLDNTALTLGAVRFRKRDTNGQLLVGLAMNRLNLRPFRAEFCSDPILLTKAPRERLTEGAFLVGNLCSESDFIFRRRLALKVMPEPDDVFCFVNTGGYLAHHMEIGTHGGPLPKNLLLNEQSFEVTDVA
jgi:diaminopimelate decarboxylase